MRRACESCANEDDDLLAVRPAEAPETLELWCPACRAEREHEPFEAD